MRWQQIGKRFVQQDKLCIQEIAIEYCLKRFIIEEKKENQNGFVKLIIFRQSRNDTCNVKMEQYDAREIQEYSRKQ